ncbi:hypothetical protein [Streptomyces sp. NPDC048623]|uniref:hypothetical protein n=1 Tax=Streptomyces sp. NPDC048623 TaxID=3155761 RepID=UPI0034372101
MVQLTPDQLVAEFQDAVVELYFARKRIANLEAENAALKARLTVPAQEIPAQAQPQPQAQAQEMPVEAAPENDGGEQWFSGGAGPGEQGPAQ